MAVGLAVWGLPVLDPAVPTVDGSYCAPGTPSPAATAFDASDDDGDLEVRHPAESEAAGEARSEESEAAWRGGERGGERGGGGEVEGACAGARAAAGRAPGTLGLGEEPDLATDGSRAGEEKGRAKEI